MKSNKSNIHELFVVFFFLFFVSFGKYNSCLRIYLDIFYFYFLRMGWCRQREMLWESGDCMWWCAGTTITELNSYNLHLIDVICMSCDEKGIDRHIWWTLLPTIIPPATQFTSMSCICWYFSLEGFCGRTNGSMGRCGCDRRWDQMAFVGNEWSEHSASEQVDIRMDHGRYKERHGARSQCNLNP